MAFNSLEPLGEYRDDLRSGIVASTIANTSRNPKKRSKPYKPEDFMPKFKSPVSVETESDDERLLQKVQTLNALFGGQDLRQT